MTTEVPIDEQIAALKCVVNDLDNFILMQMATHLQMQAAKAVETRLPALRAALATLRAVKAERERNAKPLSEILETP